MVYLEKFTFENHIGNYDSVFFSQVFLCSGEIFSPPPYFPSSITFLKQGRSRFCAKCPHCRVLPPLPPHQRLFPLWIKTATFSCPLISYNYLLSIRCDLFYFFFPPQILTVQLPNECSL